MTVNKMTKSAAVISALLAITAMSAAARSISQGPSPAAVHASLVTCPETMTMKSALVYTPVHVPDNWKALGIPAYDGPKAFKFLFAEAPQFSAVVCYYGVVSGGGVGQLSYLTYGKTCLQKTGDPRTFSCHAGL